MSIRQKQVGENLVLEAVPRTSSATRKTAATFNGTTGAVTMGDLAIAANGTVTIAGTALVGGSLADDTVLAAGKDFTYAAGDGVFDASLGTGAFKSNTGTNTLGGNVVISGAKTFTTGTGLSTFSGEVAATASAWLIADPGTGAAIPVTASGVCAITCAAAETNTLAAPAFIGQEISLILDVDTAGARVVTVASAINIGGDNTITLDNAGDFIALRCMQVAGVKVWRVVANEGAGLTTV